MQIFLNIIHLQHWRNEDNAFLDHILTVDEPWMHSFDHQTKWQHAEWHAQMSLRKKTASCSQGALRVMHIRFFGQKGTCARPFCASWHRRQGQILPPIAAGQASSSLQTTGTAGEWCHFAPGQCNTSSQSWCAKSGAMLWQGGVGIFSLLSRSCPMWLLVICMCDRTSAGGGRFESENKINTAVTDSLHSPNKDVYRAANDCSPCSGKSVWIVLVIIIISFFYSLWSTGHPWRASKHCDLQLSPWPHSMIFLYFLFRPLLSFAMLSLAYLFFYIPEDSNPMQFSLLLLLL